MNDHIDIDELVNDREAFNAFVYTNINEALVELKSRWIDEDLAKKVSDYLHDDIPEHIAEGFKVVFFRSLLTPNYELRRFMMIPDFLSLEALFWEIRDDKFTLNNQLKYYLGKIGIFQGTGKKGGSKIHFESIIDFNESHGKKINEVKTLWGQSLLDFHSELLLRTYPKIAPQVHDISEWLHKGGRSAKEYYADVIALFVRHGILFENFILDGDELDFIKTVFLPSFIDVWEKTGKKPLIVALEPTDIEGDVFWMCHTPEILEIIKQKKEGITEPQSE